MLRGGQGALCAMGIWLARSRPEALKSGVGVEDRHDRLRRLSDVKQISTVFGSKQPCRRKLSAISTSRPLAAWQFRKPTGQVNQEVSASSWDAS